MDDSPVKWVKSVTESNIAIGVTKKKKKLDRPFDIRSSELKLTTLLFSLKRDFTEDS